MKYIFLVNSFSLKSKTNKIVSVLNDVVNELGMKYVIEVNSENYSTEDILNKYRNKKYTIICLGGDGTINRTLNGIVGTKNILGYIPFGTGNDFYRTNKELLKSGNNKIDLIKINDKYFINVACFGIDADIANTDNIIHSKFIPKTARYNLSIISNFLKYKPRYFKVIVDDKEYNNYYSTIVVCNAKYYGGGYKINPKANLNDGIFELYLVSKVNKLKMAKLILSTKSGNHINNNNIRIIGSDKLILESDDVVNANIDGDIISSDRFNIELIKSGIEVYYNQELIDKVLKYKL